MAERALHGHAYAWGRRRLILGSSTIDGSTLEQEPTTYSHIDTAVIDMMNTSSGHLNPL